MNRAFDLVVLGGGTAGCVVAARASEDRGRRVLLVEAGPDPRPIPDVVADPKRQTDLVTQSPYVRKYDARRPDGSTFPLVSGRIMGGGSSVNNLAAIRPMARDFAAWRAYGGERWSYERMLPIMRAIETDLDFPDSPLHGSAGPLQVARGFRLDDPADPPVRALIDAAQDLGLPLCPDLNVPEPYGICASPYNLAEGRRQSTTVAYLEPARGRANLTIMADTTVLRLRLEGPRVKAVELLTPDGPEVVEADRFVLSAGVFESPHVLLLSGIGPPRAIEKVGLRVVHARDGVGQNYRDHAVVYVSFEGTTELREDHVIPKIRLIAKSDPVRDHPDLHVFLRSPIRSPGRPTRLPVSIHLLEHRSSGTVSLASADPDDLPTVDPGLLHAPVDIEAMIRGMGFVRRLARHPGVAVFYGPMVTPEATVHWRDHVLSSYGTYHHGVGTCRFGPEGDPGAVVGPDLRVHGIDNLWVADASVFPTAPHANTNLAAVLVGEVAARDLALA